MELKIRRCASTMNSCVIRFWTSLEIWRWWESKSWEMSSRIAPVMPCIPRWFHACCAITACGRRRRWRKMLRLLRRKFRSPLLPQFKATAPNYVARTPRPGASFNSPGKAVRPHVRWSDRRLPSSPRLKERGLLIGRLRERHIGVPLGLFPQQFIQLGTGVRGQLCGVVLGGLLMLRRQLGYTNLEQPHIPLQHSQQSLRAIDPYMNRKHPAWVLAGGFLSRMLAKQAAPQVTTWVLRNGTARKLSRLIDGSSFLH